jgi:hypothetical protein
MYKTVKKTEDWLKAKEPETNKRGNVVHRGFFSTERYIVDFADDFGSEGWQQFDTDQDAHYFGCWVNPVKFLTLTYAEGDWTLVECFDKDHYNAEIQDAINFYGEGFEFKTIDENGITEYRQDREKFLV